MYKPKTRRRCRICGIDLDLWGEDKKGNCPECVKAIRDTEIICAGKCKKKYSNRIMSAVILYFEPGKKGGEKFTVYYCQDCFLSARSKARTLCEQQQEEMKKTESRRSRQKTKFQKGKKKNEKKIYSIFSSELDL